MLSFPDAASAVLFCLKVPRGVMADDAAFESVSLLAVSRALCFECLALPAAGTE